MHRMSCRLLLGLFLLLAIVSPLRLSGQQMECPGTDGWLPAGEGYSGIGEFAATSDGNLLYLFSGGINYYIGGSKGNGVLSVWNGTTLHTLADTGLRDIGFPHMIIYKGMLYLAGIFESAGGTPGTRSLARWNGKGWESTGAIADGILGATSMIVYRDELYVGSGADGGIITSDGKNLGALSRFDGSTWRSVRIEFEPGMQTSVLAMTLFGNDLIIAGEFDRVEGTVVTGSARFNGTEWKSTPGLSGYTGIVEMVPYRDRLYLQISESGVCEWDGSNVRIINTSSTPARQYRQGSPALMVHNDRLYMFGYVALPGSPQEIRRTCAAYDGTRWQPVSSFQGEGWPVMHDGRLYAFGPLLSSCGTPLDGLALYCDDNSCARITGSLYADRNDNCSRDSGEPGLPRRIVEISPGPLYATTDDSGRYSRYLSPGSYSVSPAPYVHWRDNCGEQSPRSITIDELNEVSSGNDLGVVPIPGIRDLRVSIAGNRIRPGRKTDYILHYINIGTEPASGSIRFRYNSDQISLTASDRPVDAEESGSARWELPEMQPGETGTIIVTMTAVETLQVGEMICATLDGILHDVVEERADDNHDEVCTAVTASYDPNDITVEPSRIDFDYLFPEDTVLSYQIRFQNTGNDTAFRVVLRDTLDPSLDIPTLAFGAGSHRYDWRLEKNNILVITFDDILLPDSSTNERNSHGLVRYRIGLRQPVGSNVEIRNRVGIYFDYNPVVMTNEVVSRTQESSSVGESLRQPSMVRIYPRPAGDILYIDGPVEAGSVMTLRRIDGSVAFRSRATGEGHERLDVAGLATGIYLFEIRTATGTVGERVIIAR